MPEKWQVLGLMGGFASSFGGLHYLLRVQEGKQFKWFEFLLHSVISGFCGVLTYSLLSAYGIEHEVAGCVCGLSGWMGTQFLKIAEIAFRKKLGVTKEDLNDG